MLKYSLSKIEKIAGLSHRENEKKAVRKCLADLGMPEDYIHGPNGEPVSGVAGITMSVTHSAEWAAVCIATPEEGLFGIDIEDRNRPQLSRVAPRILSETELEAASLMKDGLAKGWTAKEALYKSCRISGLDFKNSILLAPPEFKKAEVISKTNINFVLEYIYIDFDNILCIARQIQ